MGLAYSKETILTLSRITLANARDNVDDLAEFGIHSEYLNQFESDIIIVERKYLSGMYESDQIRLNTGIYDGLAQAYGWGIKLRTRIDATLGRDSDAFRKFPASQLGKGRYHLSIMIPALQYLINLAEEYRVQLEPSGQSSEEMASGRHLLSALQEFQIKMTGMDSGSLDETDDGYDLFYKLFIMIREINRVARTVFHNQPDKRKLFENRWPGKSSSKKTA